jgi:hypothetical protein
MFNKANVQFVFPYEQVSAAKMSNNIKQLRSISRAVPAFRSRSVHSKK